MDDERRLQDELVSKLNNLEPRGSFNCVSGVLFWGMLENILEAVSSRHDEKFDGESIHSNQGGTGGGTIYQRRHNFKCRAAKGTWTRYTAMVDGANLGFFCHTDSLTPRQLVDIGSHVHFSRTNPPDPEVTKVVFVNRYDWGCHHNAGDGGVWKSRGGMFDNHVILTDPSWSMTMPPDYPGTGERPERTYGADGETELPDEETLLRRLRAKFDKGDEAYILRDPEDQACGILCQAVGHESEYFYARLVFNDDKQLVGMIFNDVNGDELFKELNIQRLEADEARETDYEPEEESDSSEHASSSDEEQEMSDGELDDLMCEGQTDLTVLLETKYGDYKKNEALTLDHLDSGRYDDDYKHFKSIRPENTN